MANERLATGSKEEGESDTWRCTVGTCLRGLRKKGHMGVKHDEWVHACLHISNRWTISTDNCSRHTLSLRHQSGRWLARWRPATNACGPGRHAWIHLSGLVWTVRKNPFGWVGYIWRLSMCPVHATDEVDIDWRVGAALGC